MSTQLDREQINRLIAEKRYDEAKNALRQSTDPSAKVWLDQLEKQFPSTPKKIPSSQPHIPKSVVDVSKYGSS